MSSKQWTTTIVFLFIGWLVSTVFVAFITYETYDAYHENNQHTMILRSGREKRLADASVEYSRDSAFGRYHNEAATRPVGRVVAIKKRSAERDEGENGSESVAVWRSGKRKVSSGKKGGDDAVTSFSRRQSPDEEKEGDGSENEHGGLREEATEALEGEEDGGGRTDTPLRVFMDWPVDDRLFTYENYKALESLFTVSPNPIVRVLLAAPGNAYTFKIGNLLSITHFIKYRKRGYDVQNIATGKLNAEGQLIAGFKYWSKWGLMCCWERCGAKCREADHVQPYHLLMFIRLTYMYKKGGVFSDFSFFFREALSTDPEVQGYYISAPSCRERRSTELWEKTMIKKLGDKFHEAVNGSLCATSTLMVFNKPKHPAILCMLKKYDEDIFFKNCIESGLDLLHGGAECVRMAMAGCFESLGYRNYLTPYLSGVPNGPLEDFGGDPDVATRVVLKQPAEKALRSKDRKVFWLGSLAFSGKWTSPLAYMHEGKPSSDALLAEAIAGLKLNNVLSTIRPPKARANSAHDAKFANLSRPDESYSLKSCSLPQQCHHYSTAFNFSLTSTIYVNKANSRTGIETASCAPSILLPGFQKAASTFLFYAISSHPQVLQPLVGSQLKEANCYRRSQRSRMWCYPFIEEGLDNFVTIDGTVQYATEPAIADYIIQDNPNVRVVFTVRHPVDRILSDFRFRYNDIYQHFFNFNSNDTEDTSKSRPSTTFDNFDEFIFSSIARDQKFGILREVMTNGSSEEAVLAQYFAPFDGLNLGVGGLFIYSIQYAAILHYAKKLGKDRVMVVNYEDLDVSNWETMHSTLASVFRFLGLCPYRIPVDQMRYITANQGGRNKFPLPPAAEISKDAYRKLTLFFRPFMEGIMDLMSGDGAADTDRGGYRLNITHWFDNDPPAYLRDYAPGYDGVNKRPPKQWFETIR